MRDPGAVGVPLRHSAKAQIGDLRLPQRSISNSVACAIAARCFCSAQLVPEPYDFESSAASSKTRRAIARLFCTDRRTAATSASEIAQHYLQPPPDVPMSDDGKVGLHERADAFASGKRDTEVEPRRHARKRPDGVATCKRWRRSRDP